MKSAHISCTPILRCGAFAKSLIALAALAAMLPVGAQSAAVTDDAPTALAPVVVTAQKRQQSTQDVPIAMTVLNADALEKTRAGSLEDLQQLAPSFSLDDQSGYHTVTVRGVGGGGRNIGFDPRVGVYVDGIYMGQSQALEQPLFDVEQVEILRGPQGYLFGRNTVAGAVNITTAAPTKSLQGFVSGDVGSHGTQNVSASFSGPIADKVLGKLSLSSESHGGFITNTYNGQKIDDLKRETVRGQLLFQASDKLKISVAADSSHTNQQLVLGEPVTASGQQLTGATPIGSVDFNVTPKETTHLSGASVTANYALDGGNTLTAIVGQRSTRQVKTNDTDYSVVDQLSVHYADDFKQTSEEVRMASSNQLVARYVVGVFHLNESADTARAANLGAAFGPAAGLSVTNSGTVKTDTSALYGSLDYDLLPALTLNLGARYTHETKNVLFNLGSAAPGLAALFGVGTLNNYTNSRDENNLSPSIGAIYALSKEQNLYAKFSRGYKSGGWNVDFISAAAATNPSFSTESVATYEIGTKGQMLGGRLRYDLSVYDSTFKNFQVFQFVNLGATSVLQLTNAAGAQSKGMDGSLTWRATKQLDLGVNFGVVHATFSSFSGCTATLSCTGNQLPYAPKFTSALTANYGLPVASLNGKLNFYGEYSYRTKSFSDPVNDPVTQSLPSRELVNARVAFSTNDSHWDFNLWAHNVFNKDSVTLRGQDFLGTYIVKRMEPRMVGIQVKYFFD